MSAGTATKAKKKAPAKKAEQEPVLVQEAATLPKPEGMPHPWPLHALPRSRRGIVKKEWGATIQTLVDAGLVDDEGSVSFDTETLEDGSLGYKMALAGDVDIALGHLTEALVASAAPGEAEVMRRWCEDADDETFMQAFGWYAGMMNPGEASSSQ